MAQVLHFYFSLLNPATLSEGDYGCFLFPPLMCSVFAKLSHKQVLLWHRGKVVLILILYSSFREHGSFIVGSGLGAGQSRGQGGHRGAEHPASTSI